MTPRQVAALGTLSGVDASDFPALTGADHLDAISLADKVLTWGETRFPFKPEAEAQFYALVAAKLSTAAVDDPERLTSAGG